MKSLYLSIITGVGIVIVIFFSLYVTTNTSLFSTGNIRIEKIQRLADYYTILHIHNPNLNGSDVDTSTGDYDWSHDGKFAAFNMNAGAPVSYLWIISSDGKEIKQINIPIEFNFVDYIHISPDDNSIYFIGQYNNKSETYEDIFRYYLDNQSYSLITKNSHIYSFGLMPNGNLVYVETHSNSTRLEKDKPIFLVRHYDVLWLATPNGNKIRPIHNGTELFDQMAVSPDGKNIIFIARDDHSNPSDNGTSIDNMGSLGGGFEPNPSSYLTVFDTTTNRFNILAKAIDDSFWNPRWSPDGNSILYELALHKCVQDKRLDEQSCPAGLLNLISLSDNSTETLYGNKIEPYTAPLVGAAISKDGKSIIFGINYDYSNGDIDGRGIYRIDLVGLTQRNIS